jgi:hypothetical protein
VEFRNALRKKGLRQRPVRHAEKPVILRPRHSAANQGWGIHLTSAHINYRIRKTPAELTETESIQRFAKIYVPFVLSDRSAQKMIPTRLPPAEWRGRASNQQSGECKGLRTGQTSDPLRLERLAACDAKSRRADFKPMPCNSLNGSPSHRLFDMPYFPSDKYTEHVSVPSAGCRES